MNDVTYNHFKSDVFSLGFCFLYVAALNFNLFYQDRDICDKKNNLFTSLNKLKLFK